MMDRPDDPHQDAANRPGEAESVPQPTGPAPPPPKISEQEARNWAVFCHLAGLAGLIPFPATNVIGPLILWLIKKDDHPLVDRQGKEALNFQISILIYALISSALMFLVIGFLLLPAVFIIYLVFLIIAAVKTSRGEEYRYPLTIRLIR